MIGFKGYWYGKEVEGRFTDIDTLFIADFKSLPPNFNIEQPHVYVCSGATQQLIDENNWQMIFEMIKSRIISIEVTPGMLEKVPAMLRIHCHILLMLSASDAKLLKKTDSIKVVYDDYSLYCTTVHNMQQVTPDDYKFDIYE
jgi:hypothetical protein